MAAITGVELFWLGVAWSRGIAPSADMISYLGIAFVCLAMAALLRLALGKGLARAPRRSILIGTILVGFGASAFLPLKYAIPNEVPFWLDAPLAAIERAGLGVDPWLVIDHVLGWAIVPMDWLYGCWLPAQSLVLFCLILARPSPAKSRALVAYTLAWFLLGAVAAVLLSSAGPLFYDRLYGGTRFANLGSMLHARGARIALAESDSMWAAAASRQPGLVAGISAMPSIHVAISLWIYLVSRQMTARAAPAALCYFVLVWLGSVQLGWHYASDGLVGALGMLVIWRLSNLFPLAGGAPFEARQSKFCGAVSKVVAAAAPAPTR